MQFVIRWLLVISTGLSLFGCVTMPSKDVNREPPAEALTTVFRHVVPPRAPVPSQKIVTTGYLTEQAKFKSAPWALAKFRPNINMPELLEEDLLEKGSTEAGRKELNRQMDGGSKVIWVVPRVELLPCDSGCVGNKTYDKMAKRFLASYNEMVTEGNGTVAFRGSMRVKVRWFREKTFLESINPISFAQEVFAIQFPIEGNLLTISSVQMGKNSKVETAVQEVATSLKATVIFPLQVGARNSWSVQLDPDYDPSVLQKLDSYVAPINSFLRDLTGQEDYSPRLDPITAEHRNLFPAIDGLLPGEGVSLPKEGRKFTDG